MAGLDHLQWTRFYAVALLALGVGWAFDAFKITLISNVLGIQRGQQQLDGNRMGGIFGVWFIGVKVGALALTFGVLADRFGRMRVFPVSLLIYGGVTAPTGLASS